MDRPMKNMTKNPQSKPSFAQWLFTAAVCVAISAASAQGQFLQAGREVAAASSGTSLFTGVYLGQTNDDPTGPGGFALFVDANRKALVIGGDPYNDDGGNALYGSCTVDTNGNGNSVISDESVSLKVFTNASAEVSVLAAPGSGNYPWQWDAIGYRVSSGPFQAVSGSYSGTLSGQTIQGVLAPNGWFYSSSPNHGGGGRCQFTAYGRQVTGTSLGHKVNNYILNSDATISMTDSGSASATPLILTRVDSLPIPPPITGALQATLTPPAAVSAGAEWRVDGGAYHHSGATVSNVVVGSNHVVSFRAVTGFATPANQSVSISNGLISTVVSMYSDTNKPTVALVSPTAGLNVSNAALIVVGTARDNVAMQSVVCLVNGTNVIPSQTAGSWSNWTAHVTLMPGTNSVAAYSTDTSGNISKTNTVAFIYNRYLLAQGAYYGLVAVTNEVREQAASGGFSFTLAGSGSFSGQLIVGTNTNNLSGKFDVSGYYQTNLVKGQLMVSLQLDFENQAVGGTVSNGLFTAQLAGFQNVFSTHQPATKYMGIYTLVIPGTNDPFVGPAGTGYGTVKVASSGGITFAGYLADGTSVSQVSAVSKDGDWPFYVPLYGGKGSLWAWNTISNHQITASASWLGASPKSGAYSGGFTNQHATVTGSWYASTNRPLFGITNGQVVLDQRGASPFTILNHVLISPSGAITVTNATEKTNKLTLKINTANGVISGSVANPLNPKQTIPVNGVLMQSQTNAQGYFPGTNQSGVFLLTP
jgi:hypothetical protein